MVRLRTTVLIVLLPLSLMATAVAQRPLNPPNYYLFELARLQPGEPIRGELTVDDGQNFKDGAYVDLFAIEGRAGQRVSVMVSSDVFDPYVTLYDPHGFVVVMNDDHDGMFTDAGFTVELADAGRYLVVVSGYSQFDLGTYTVSFDESGGSTPEARSVTLPTAVQSELDPLTMPALDSWLGPTEYFSFDVTEPVVLMATMSSLEFDTMLTLLDEDSVQIAQNDDADFTSDSRLFARLEPGRYLIAATSYFPDGYGRYELSLETYVRSE